MTSDKNSVLVAFGSVIKERRIELKLTQDKLALYSGVDRSYISEIERGLKNPSLTIILDLCRVLDIKPNNLFLKYETKIDI